MSGAPGSDTTARRTTARAQCALFIAALLSSLLSCSAPTKDTPAPSATAPLPARKQLSSQDLKKLERELHDRINGERVKRGLPTMRWDPALSGIARKHSADMAKNGYFGHTSADGHDQPARYMQAGYACGVTIDGVLRQGAENIHLLSPLDGEDPAGTTMESWMENKPDRKNIFSPHWGREGVGISPGPGGVLFITLDIC